jgi:threonyl-tRNA synthetase
MGVQKMFGFQCSVKRYHTFFVSDSFLPDTVSEKEKETRIMIITLKDGSKKEYAEAKSVIDIAADISEGLARVACAGEVDGEVVDLRHVVDKDCELSILTFEDEGGKGAFRHTTSHIMAQAIKRLYPDVKLAIGPSIADGFYYDIDSENPITTEDLAKIEVEMKW